MKISNVDLLAESGAVEMDDDFELPAISVAQTVNYAIQLVFTGTPDGVLKLQASNDDTKVIEAAEHDPSVIVNWTDIANSSQIITAAGNHMWSVENAGYMWVRVVFEHSASTGSLESARLFKKDA